MWGFSFQRENFSEEKAAHLIRDLLHLSSSDLQFSGNKETLLHTAVMSSFLEISAMAGRKKKKQTLQLYWENALVQQAGRHRGGCRAVAAASCTGSRPWLSWWEVWGRWEKQQLAAADAGGRSSKAEALARSAGTLPAVAVLKYVSRFHFMRLVLLVVWSEARGFPWIALPGVSVVT